jgi:cob(I)alamin adenosyltransferase
VARATRVEPRQYNRGVKIYTRTGDAGQTALFDGTRVSKADPRVDAYGEIDELNAALGLARAQGVDEEVADLVVTIQRELHAIAARLADPHHRIAARVTKVAIDEAAVARLEQTIDHLESGLPPLTHFILSGGAPAAATVHLARTICRRAERRMVSLGEHQVEPEVLVYVNRLSDLLFVLARAINHRAGVPETEW